MSSSEEQRHLVGHRRHSSHLLAPGKRGRRRSELEDDDDSSSGSEDETSSDNASSDDDEVSCEYFQQTANLISLAGPAPSSVRAAPSSTLWRRLRHRTRCDPVGVLGSTPLHPRTWRKLRRGGIRLGAEQDIGHSRSLGSDVYQASHWDIRILFSSVQDCINFTCIAELDVRRVVKLQRQRSWYVRGGR